MVISIVALLIALLLPALSRARESAQVALCLSKQKQLVLATLQYAEDHDGIVPPGDDGRAPGWPAGTWPNILLPWAGNEDIYKCPNARFPDNHIVYAPNGHMWLFYAHWGFPHRGIPTNIHTVKTPGRLLHMTENAEDIAIDQRNLSVWPWPGANYSSSFKHYISFNPGTYGNAGHHFRGGGGGSTESWGFSTNSFYDGHAITVSMEQLVTQAVSGGRWFEFPFVPAAMQNDPSVSSFVPMGPQPGAQWWTYPQW